MHCQCEFKKIVGESAIERELIKNIEYFLEQEKIRHKAINKKEIINPKYNIERLKEQINRLNYSWQTGKILEVEQYEKQYNELVRKIDELQAETPKYTARDFSRIEKILSDGWKDIYKTLAPVHKRAFWRSFIKNIEIEWTTDKKEIKRIIFFLI